MNLEPTGERMILEHYSSSVEHYVIYIIHIATYNFAEQFAKAKRVLDYGCGSGYGAARISAVADHVYAVDVAEDAIAYARQHYERVNLKFHCVAPDSQLPFPDQSFDTVLSFQVFEHIPKTDHYLSEIRRVLAPGGCLLLVTPNRSTRLFPFQRPWNRWHVREYNEKTLSVALNKFFSSVQIQHLSGRKDMIDVELRRCSKLKWATLPFTLPFIPDFLRVGLLNLIHEVRGRPKVQQSNQKFGFSELDITITADARRSLDLVAVARK